MDNKYTSGKEKGLEDMLDRLRLHAVKVNKEWAKKLGISQAAAITCVKPSGTVSQLVDSASGIHARHNPYYIRTVRGDKKDPLTQMMIEAGFPAEDDQMNPMHTTVFSFPIKCNSDAVFRTDLTAIEQLELWKTYQKHWCEHKPSVTINYTDKDFLSIGQWVWDNWDLISGISFLPHSDHVYEQAPFEAIDMETFLEMDEKMPSYIEWADLSHYELEDTTTNSHTLACSGGSCEVVDVVEN